MAFVRTSVLGGASVAASPRTLATHAVRRAAFRPARQVLVRAEVSDDVKTTGSPDEASLDRNVIEPVVQTTSAQTVAARPGFGEVMAFNGAPEIINGRLAMLAFIAALGAELSTGETVITQLFDAPILVAVTAVVFSWASLVPWLKGDKDSKGLGPFTPAAELLNGRAAMLGFAALLAVEAIKHSALF
eukprot:jgi/Botrbrau1/23403/Bobra.0051s0047.1